MTNYKYRVKLSKYFNIFYFNIKYFNVEVIEYIPKKYESKQLGT